MSPPRRVTFSRNHTISLSRTHAQLDDNLDVDVDVAVRLGLVRRQSDTIELAERGQAVAAAEIDR
jgi:hypothetical protein